MKQLPFFLIPFTKATERSASSRFSIDGTLRRGKKFIEVEYNIKDPYFDILWPAQVSSPARKDELWQHTCLELFLAPWGIENYWEFNFTSNSDWNCYRFDSYRANQQPEKSIHGIRSTFIETGETSHQLKASVPIIESHKTKTISVGICAVVEDKTGTLHYYALAHSGSSPDFHLRNSFMLTLAPH